MTHRLIPGHPLDSEIILDAAISAIDAGDNKGMSDPMVSTCFTLTIAIAGAGHVTFDPSGDQLSGGLFLGLLTKI